MNHEYQSLKKINDLFGMDELKAFAEKLVVTAENAQNRSIQYPPLPNLIVSCGSGYGITSHISLISELIREARLMRFIGEEEYFEMTITNVKKDIDRLLERISIAAGFYGEFRGVIGLNISSFFEERTDYKDARYLMDFVDLQQGRILFIFIVPLAPDEKQMTAFLHQFSSRTPVEVIRLPFPETTEVMKFLEDQLENNNMTLSEDAEAELISVVNELRNDAQFSGYRTLNNLINELVWNKLSSPSGCDGIIGLSDIEFLSGDKHLLDVVRTQTRNHEKIRHIGFF